MSNIEAEQQKLDELQEVAHNAATAPLPANPKENALANLTANLDYLSVLLQNTNLSNKHLKNVMLWAAVNPFSSGEINFSYPDQKEIFETLEAINNVKMVLYNIAMDERNLADKIKEENKNESERTI